MYNFEYYGFSLLCYIQRECNSHFRPESESSESEAKVEERPGFFQSESDGRSRGNITEVHRVLNYELRLANDPTASGRPALSIVGKDGELESPGYIDYSRLEEVEELDLVSKWYGGSGDGEGGEGGVKEAAVLPAEDVRVLGDACYELGLTGVLWQVSQWTPDRKRSTLVMVDDNGPLWSRGRIIAASVSDKSFNMLTDEELQSYIIRVTSSQMERLCIRFNELRQQRDAEKREGA